MKQEVKRITICGLHDQYGTSLDFVTYDDGSINIDITGNRAGLILSLMHKAKDGDEVDDIMDNLLNIAKGYETVENKEGEFVVGSCEEILNKFANESDLKKKAIALNELVKNIRSEDELLYALTRIKTMPDFEHKDNIIKRGVARLKNGFHV